MKVNNAFKETSLLDELPIVPLEENSFGSYASTLEFWSSVMLFGLSVLVFVLISNRMRESNHDPEPSEILKTFGIPFIIISAVFVVILTPNEKTITPIIGLMGTIAGYLLGKYDTPRIQTSQENNTPPLESEGTPVIRDAQENNG